ncbi:carbon-nitrogen hydrolase family protein [Tindallia californiensis]|uniref:Predicted amidohydrolase n=1 Tax=Tindallia californiensis TaxID=159292 RepID=A0A1H3MN59_9FIRM|nr:carbon-nitrogen hydrolase family protein [Tindallia californiensis]SDY78026.1 Predicted amidohydrolase [Tindallia californiensis]
MSDLRKKVVERWFSEDTKCPTIMMANITTSSNRERNMKKIEEIIQIAHEKKVNILILPELCISGYLWETENPKIIRDHLRNCSNQEIQPWLDRIRDSLDDSGKGLEYVIFNNARPVNGDFYNSTYFLHPVGDCNELDRIYDKIFLTPIEVPYFRRGTDRRLILDTHWGKFGFLTCYDLCFMELPRKYAMVDEVDAIITVAAWRSQAIREYAMMNVRTDNYYGYLWNLMNSSKAAYNQVWSLGVNCVGSHEVNGSLFWGGSGVWAPSGLPLLQGSNMREELLIIHHLDIANYEEKHSLEFNYRMEFNNVYKEIKETYPEPVVVDGIVPERKKDL